MTVTKGSIWIGKKLFSHQSIESFKKSWTDPSLTYIDCAAVLGVAGGSVYFYAQRLGMGKRPISRSKFPGGSDDIIRRDIGKIPLVDIAKRLGVSRSGLKKRAMRMGLSARAIRAAQPKSAKPPKAPKSQRAAKAKASAPTMPNANSGFFSPRPKKMRKFAQETRGEVVVRRFEMGASGIGSDDFLKRAGFVVVVRMNKHYEVRPEKGTGRPKKLSHQQLIDFLDEQRIKRGLEPVLRRA